MISRKILLSAALTAAAVTAGAPAQAGDSPFVGQIAPYGMNFCPANWLPADGRLLSIAENDVLFALYGTTYGGDGQSTFALPDLRGRVAFGDGFNQGNQFLMGQQMGTETFTVTTATMPAHTHTGTLSAVAANGDTNVPTGNSLASIEQNFNRIYTTRDPANNMKAGDVVIDPAGSGTPVSLTAPALTMTYCVALFGIFPQRP